MAERGSGEQAKQVAVQAERNARRLLVGAAAFGGGAAAVTLSSAVGAAAYFARRVLTPDRNRPDDVVIEAVGTDSVTLSATPETIVPGRYGLWLDGGSGHARVGDIQTLDLGNGLVVRDLLGVDAGQLRPGPARWNQYFHGGPPDVSLGLPTEHVHIDTEVGPMPAWVVPADGGSAERWAVLVHGRGARREECLRGIPPLREAGLSVLVPSYRNDEGAPAGPDGRYNLGLSEWHDIEEAVLYAVSRGAREVVLGGWSMGGAIVLQLLDRSWVSGFVSGVVLDGPVIDWGDVLRHHAQLNRVPAPLAAVSNHLMGQRWARRLVGVHEPVDVALTDWVARSRELRHRVLLIHSRDDEFVPVGPSAALGQARPDLVQFEPWTTARHVKEWNVDPARWERLVREFVNDL